MAHRKKKSIIFSSGHYCIVMITVLNKSITIDADV